MKNIIFQSYTLVSAFKTTSSLPSQSIKKVLGDQRNNSHIDICTYGKPIRDL